MTTKMMMLFYEDSFCEWMLELAQGRIKFQNFQSRPNQWERRGEEDEDDV